MKFVRTTNEFANEVNFSRGIMSVCQTAIPSAKAEDPTTYNYTEASRSGLKTVRPYPSPDDVCQLLRVNRVVEDLVVEDRTLIACPKHEKGALADRRRAGCWQFYALGDFEREGQSPGKA